MEDSASCASDTDYTSVAVDQGAAAERGERRPPNANDRWKENERRKRPEKDAAGPTADTSQDGLPLLAPRYLDTSVKLDALQRLAKQRREAAATKSRLQSMFRQLDALEKRERERATRTEESVCPPGRVSRKLKRRHEAAIMRHRHETAYRPVVYAGPAAKSPSPVRRMIRGELPHSRAHSALSGAQPVGDNSNM